MGNCFNERRPQDHPNLQKTKPSQKYQLDKKQIEYLTLIFNDLAYRSKTKLLTQHHFCLFFQLTGLWGDKLFKQFALNNQTQITLDEFINGIRKIVRASFDQKVQFLFKVIKNPTDSGIKYKQFLKMLYHYSKPELKQIMTNDGVFVHEAIIPTSVQLRKQSQVVHLQHQPQLERRSPSDANLYLEVIRKINMEYQDPGTLIQFKTKEVTYQVSYCNMSNLTKQYTSHIFKKYHINQEKQSMNQQQFKDYIRGNMKLFITYYAVFHEEIWGYKNSPQFIKNIEKQSNVIYSEGGIKRNAYMMLVSDTLIISQSQAQKQRVLRMIVLEGVAVNQQEQKKIVIKDQPQGNYRVQIQFSSTEYDRMWLQQLKSYTNNYFQNKYQVLESVGTGQFSVVFKCRERATNKQYALKKLQLDKLKQKQIAAIENQAQINKILNSPHYAKLHQTIFTKKIIYIVSQYIYGQDLFQFVRKRKRLSQSEAAFILAQIIQAVMHLHSIQIVHRDLKPENIMVSYRKPKIFQDQQASPQKISKPKPEKIKIIDFGFANYLSVLQSKKQDIPVGTIGYMAPQLLLGEKPSYENDIFSIGCIMYFMLRGKYPFTSTNPQGTAIATVKCMYNLNDAVWEEISEQAKDLLKKLITKTPEQRISLADAIKHPWFSLVKKYYAQSQVL